MAYRILQKNHYYNNHINPPPNFFVREYAFGCGGRVLEFDTPQDAQDYIDEVIGDDPLPYLLRHGEFAAPSYVVINMDALPGDCLTPDGDETGYTPVSEDNVPPDVLDELLSSNVEYHSGHTRYQIWTASTRDNDGDHWEIIFCPTTLALELYKDDLGRLDWGKCAFCTDAIL